MPCSVIGNALGKCQFVVDKLNFYNCHSVNTFITFADSNLQLTFFYKTVIYSSYSLDLLTI